MIYGTEGVGKSTTASQAPSPVFIPTEDGLDQIACDSFPLAKSYGDVMQALSALYAEPHDYQTVVVDSLDWLERLIWDEVCREYGVKSIEKVDGGYSKGYSHALTQWRKVVEGLDALRNQRGMCVILLAHAKVEKFEDPESAAYDRYSPGFTNTPLRSSPSGVTACSSRRGSSGRRRRTRASTVPGPSRCPSAPTGVSASSAP